jgi:hypothetical protein
MYAVVLLQRSKTLNIFVQMFILHVMHTLIILILKYLGTCISLFLSADGLGNSTKTRPGNDKT